MTLKLASELGSPGIPGLRSEELTSLREYRVMDCFNPKRVS